MSIYTNLEYLKNIQYKTSANLDIRCAFLQKYGSNQQGWFPWIFETLENLGPQARVLELGCGTGLLWKSCTERIPRDWVITLSDFSEAMLQAAWRNLVVTGRAFKYKLVDAGSIPYPDGSFDIVIANHMLYHLPELPAALKELRRVLRPGGHLLATTSGEKNMQELNTWIQHIHPAKKFIPYKRSFSLENGSVILKEFFSEVNIHRYPDQLRIIDPNDLMAYFHSGIWKTQLAETDFENLKKYLVEEFLHQKEIFLTRDTGLFLASSDNGSAKL